MQTPSSLSDRLSQLQQDHATEAVTLGNLVHKLGINSFGLLFTLLSLPSALPIPAPGYSTPFGIAILILSIQLIQGRRELWLPSKIKEKSLSPKFIKGTTKAGLKVLRFLEPIIHPRITAFRTPAGRVLIGTLIAIMAILMILPIPLTNTAPAMVIFAFGLGLSENDGLFVLLAILGAFLGITLYSIVVTTIILYGPEVITQAITYLKSLIT